MKQILILAVAWITATSAYGQATNVSVNAIIPDNDLNGLGSSITLAGLSGAINSVTVNLNITGGYNGDLYAYLQGPNGGFAVLLNRVGVSGASQYGYQDPGFDVTLSDLGASNIQYYQANGATYNLNGQLTATWQPEGVTIDPQSPPADFASAAQTAMLSSFTGLDANGRWNLFVADVSPGGQSTLVSWGLTISTVPEPQTWALIGLGFLTVWWRRRFFRGATA